MAAAVRHLNAVPALSDILRALSIVSENAVYNSIFTINEWNYLSSISKEYSVAYDKG
jgi:hypothetical protein